MKICAAQIKPVKGDILANIEAHKKLVNLAVSGNANAIFFPELSLTGYEPGLAKQLVLDRKDKRLDNFQQISDTHNITIGIGAPAKSEKGILISTIIFQPGKPRLLYSKQKLHPDEFPYFACGNDQIILTIDTVKVAPAICYESLQADHSENAGKLGADIYVASVAKSQNGIDAAQQHFPNVAKNYGMTVIMSNCTGYCDNFESAGKSSVWTPKGNLAGQLGGQTEGILIFDTDTEEIVIKNTG